MKNTKLNAQKILNKHCGLNDETATGISVINAMIEYGHNLVKNNVVLPDVSISYCDCVFPKPYASDNSICKKCKCKI